MKNVWKVFWKINNIVSDPVMDCRAFDSIFVIHCFRESNQVADLLAHKGHSVRIAYRWFEVHDLVFLSII